MNEDAADLAKTATACASTEEQNHPAANVLNGITRAIDGSSNAWHSLPLQTGKEETLTLTLNAPATVQELQLVFDSNFNLEKKITLSSTRQNQQKIGVPEELVRSFTVELLQNGKLLAKQAITDNIQRLVRIPLPPTVCDTVRIRFSETWGDPCIKLFEARIY